MRDMSTSNAKASMDMIEVLNDATRLVADKAMAASQEQVQLTLAQVPIGQKYIVKAVLSDSSVPEWQQQLEDIGFIAGEPVSLMAKGALGGDPLVVRVGLSTFALRKAEAACILLEQESSVAPLKAAA